MCLWRSYFTLLYVFLGVLSRWLAYFPNASTKQWARDMRIVFRVVGFLKQIRCVGIEHPPIMEVFIRKSSVHWWMFQQGTLDCRRVCTNVVMNLSYNIDIFGWHAKVRGLWIQWGTIFSEKPIIVVQKAYQCDNDGRCIVFEWNSHDLSSSK